MTAASTTDFLVVGGGIVGLTLALELKRRYGDCSVTLLEKEPACGLHASSRNSGVLHAGFYYTADTLKARLTLQGNRRLTDHLAAWHFAPTEEPAANLLAEGLGPGSIHVTGNTVVDAVQHVWDLVTRRRIGSRMGRRSYEGVTRRHGEGETRRGGDKALSLEP